LLRFSAEKEGFKGFRVKKVTGIKEDKIEENGQKHSKTGVGNLILA
jgi:hypothetical protein